MRLFSSIVSASTLISYVPTVTGKATPLHEPQQPPRLIYIGPDKYNGSNCPYHYLPGRNTGSSVIAYDQDSACVRWSSGILAANGRDCPSGCVLCPEPPRNCPLDNGGCCVVEEPCVCDDMRLVQPSSSAVMN